MPSAITVFTLLAGEDRTARLRDRQDQHFPDRSLPEMGALGLHGITVEEEYGGTGLAISSIAWRWKRSPRFGFGGLSYGAHSNLCVNQLRRNGTEAQKRK